MYISTNLLREEDMFSNFDTDRLLISVIDYDILKSNDFMGCFSLSKKELFDADSSETLSGSFILLDSKSGLKNHLKVFRESPEGNAAKPSLKLTRASTNYETASNFIESSFDKFSLAGTGAFGAVFEAFYGKEKKVAVKLVAKALIETQAEVEDLKSESAIGKLIGKSSQSQKNFLVGTFGSFQTPELFIFIMPLMRFDLGSVKADLKTNTSIYRYVFGCVILILDALKEFRIIHRDLKVI